MMVIMKVSGEIVTSNQITQPVYMRNPKEVADKFNNFFVSVGVRASHASKSLIELHNLPPPADTTKAPEIFEADKFQFQAVSTHKTPGHDKITMSVIKDSLPGILPVLTGIMNRSLSSVVPSDRKISEVTPLLKEGDHEIANNNRPVSLPPVASKDLRTSSSKSIEDIHDQT